MATLYAQPTKEWVIPAKPKPGRKPKRDEPAADEEGGSDFKVKKVQNRAAQRAFRERKQSQLADLQARLTQYEQGEIERNVALQNVAKKLKEENERLKSDNEKLREEGDRVRQENMLMRTRLRELQEEFSAYRRSVDPSSHLELESFINTRKRTRTDSTASSNTAAHTPAPTTSGDLPATRRKRNKHDNRTPAPSEGARRPSFGEARRVTTKGYSTLPPDYAPPPQPAFVYSPTSTDTSSRPSLVISSGISANSPTAESLAFDGISSHADPAIHDFGSDLDSDSEGLNVVDCGFCSKEPEECVCRAISKDLNQLIDSVSSKSPSGTLLDDSAASLAGSMARNASTVSPKISILDNLPPVQPAVPLKLRRSKQSVVGASTGSTEDEAVHLTPVPQLFRLQNSKPASRPVCSGDPSNCAACADDPFGRAFCTALAKGGRCRDNNCTRCPKTRPSPLSKARLTAEDTSKQKSIPMDADPGSSSSAGLGVGMSMETGMLLCCGDPKLCGGSGCGIRASTSPSKASQPNQPALRATGSSSAQFDRPGLHAHSITDIEDVGEDCPRLPSFTIREGQGRDVDKEAAAQDIPTNEAWERLKAHPNVAFADLALLADVVARRNKCTGPRISLSPTPDGHTESRNEKLAGDSPGETGSADPLQLTPKLVPQAALVRCGQERLMRVQAEGVRDALAMLDVQRPA